MITHELSRRTFLGGAAASPLVLSALSTPARAADTTISIVYVGSRQDYGWNQAHAVAAKALKEIPGVRSSKRRTCRKPWRS
jgi:basic membrane protein A and related proteins